MFAAALIVIIWGMTIVSYADSSKITTIALNFKSDIVVDEPIEDNDVTVTTKSTKYYVDYIEFENDVFKWSIGDIPKLNVYLVADGDYYFSLASKESVTLKGAGAKYISAKKRDSSKTFIIKLSLAALGSDDLQKGATSDEIFSINGKAGWMSMGLASWTEMEEAKNYEVILMRDGKKTGATVTTEETQHDFTSFMRKPGTYKFKMRGLKLGSTNKASSWIESDVCVVDEASAAAFSLSATNDTGWKRNAYGWWYTNEDGTYTVENWQNIDDKWYYFNEYGYMQTGWIEWEGKWYFCGADGAMKLETTTSDGYYLGSDGARVE